MDVSEHKCACGYPCADEPAAARCSAACRDDRHRKRAEAEAIRAPSWPPECTCSEDRNGGDPRDHTASCAWANAVEQAEEIEALRDQQRGAVEADRATAERLLRYFRSYYMKPGEKALMTDEHIRWAAEEFVVANRPRGAVDR